MALWSNLFTQAPTVFEAYNDTASAVGKMRAQSLINGLNQVKLKYAEPEAQQSLSQAIANTGILQTQNKFEPILDNLKVQNAQLDGLIKSQTFKGLAPAQQAALHLKQSQINYVQAKIKMLPQQMAAQQKRTDWYQSAAYQFSKTLHSLPANMRAAYIHDHIDLYNQLLQQQQQAALTASTPPASAGAPGGTPTTPLAAPPGAPPDISALSDTGMPDDVTAGLTDTGDITQGAPDMGANAQSPEIPPIAPPATVAPTQGAPSPNNAPSDVTPPVAPPQKSNLNALKFAAEIDANKKSVSPQIYKRFENSMEFENWLSANHYDRIAKNAALYAGALGKGKAALDAIKRDNPQSYEDYLEFHNSFASTAANYNKVMEGLGVQESQRNEILGNVTQAFNSYSGNPDRALDQYNRWKDNLRRVARSASLVAQPIYPGTLEKHYNIDLSEPSGVGGMVNILVNGVPASIPAANLKEALKRPGIKLDNGG
jgi:hypothetical protein